MEMAAVEKILGGKKALQMGLNNRMDFVTLSDRGVSKGSLLHLAKFFNISVHELAKILPVTERTIQRYTAKKRLSPVVSEHVLEIAEVAARGVSVFGEKEKFLQWLNLPCRALGDKTPMSLLASRFGAEMVLDELGRIEHGVLS